MAALAAGSFAAAAQCNPPSSLNVTNVTSTSATLVFPTPTPAPTGFGIVYQGPTGAAQVVSPTPTASPVVLPNLLPGTAYTVTLVSQCGATVSTAITTTFTTGAAASCPAVTNLVATRTGTALSVTATATPGATGYFFALAALSGTPAGTGAGTAPQYTFTGLDPATSYRVCIESICPGSGAPPAACTTVAAVLATRPGAGPAGLGLAPNPARHAAVLTLPADWNPQGGEVSILSLQGRVRRLPLPVASSCPLDLSGLAPGVYAVLVQTPLHTAVKRLVVE